MRPSLNIIEGHFNGQTNLNKVLRVCLAGCYTDLPAPTGMDLSWGQPFYRLNKIDQTRVNLEVDPHSIKVQIRPLRHPLHSPIFLILTTILFLSFRNYVRYDPAYLSHVSFDPVRVLDVGRSLRIGVNQEQRQVAVSSTREYQKIVILFLLSVLYLGNEPGSHR